MRPDLVKRIVLGGVSDAESYFNDVWQWGRDEMAETYKVAFLSVPKAADLRVVSNVRRFLAYLRRERVQSLRAMPQHQRINPPNPLRRCSCNQPLGKCVDQLYPILFLSLDADPVAPPSSAVKMSRGFGNESATLLVQRTAHPPLCTSKHIHDYFFDGKVPPNGTHCTPDATGQRESNITRLNFPYEMADSKNVMEVRDAKCPLGRSKLGMGTLACSIMSTSSGLNKRIQEPTNPSAAFAEHFTKLATHQPKSFMPTQLDPFISDGFYHIVQPDSKGNHLHVALLDQSWIEEQNEYQVTMIETPRPAYRSWKLTREWGVKNGFTIVPTRVPTSGDQNLKLGATTIAR
ncbi:hypothetical protein FRC06_006670, partial [Ceratobasidium sp. 370]